MRSLIWSYTVCMCPEDILSHSLKYLPTILSRYVKNVPSDMCAQRRFESTCTSTVWSVFILRGNFASLAIQKSLSEASDQSTWAARMRRLIWIYAGRTWPKVHFLTLRRKLYWLYNEPGHSISYKTACVPSEDSDQPALPCSLIRFLAGQSVSSQGSKTSLGWSESSLGSCVIL